MPAIIILELVEGMLITPFQNEMLINSDFRMISLDPEFSAWKTKRVNLKELVFYNDKRQVDNQKIRTLANQIKATRSRPRFIKSIHLSFMMTKV